MVDLYQSKINERRPFGSDILPQLQSYYRVGLTWSSNALEGNTLTESETKVLIEDGLTIGGKPLRHTLEAIGHAKAYDFMFTLIKGKAIKEADILKMHQMFYEGIQKDYSGVYRNIDVFISGSQYAVTAPGLITGEMADLFHWVEAQRAKIHPVVFAAQLHKRFVFIHPFRDGNGRIARLLMNTALMQDGYMLAVIPPVCRLEYIQLLEKAHKNDKPFERFIAERVIETQKDIMRLLHIEIPKITK